MKKTYGKIPVAMHYKDLSKFLGKKPERTFSLGKDVFKLVEKMAKLSPRKRFLILLHDELKETSHMMINTLVKGTYAPPHKHMDPNTSEGFVALKGSAKIVEFSESGKINKTISFGKGFESNVVEIKPKTIHSIIPLTKVFVCYEVKGQTSYDPTKDKSFFKWAPREDSDPKEIKEFISKMEKAS